MPRRPLLAILTAAAIGLAACGPAGTIDDVTGTTPPAATPDTTEAADSTDSTEPTEAGSPTDTHAPTPHATDPGSAPVAPVALAFDGHEVPVATRCAGADGAILATTDGEVTISLIREEGIALRYEAEGSTAETDEVAVTGGTDTTTYTATLSSDQVDPVEVTMVVMDDAMAALEPC